MSASAFYSGLLYAWLGLALAVFIALFFYVAPYGRHTRRGWGPLLGDQLGWVLMEAPAALVLPAFFFTRARSAVTLDVVWLALWELHYIYRAFVYPLLRRSARRAHAAECGGDGRHVQCRQRLPEWLLSLQIGATLPVGLAGRSAFYPGGAAVRGGGATHVWADHRLRTLRASGKNEGYRIPQGGLFRWVSCPNYLGEIVEWCGWALATWSLAGLSFALWTVANLAPRARAHHHWYHAQFSDYPPERKALLPGLW